MRTSTSVHMLSKSMKTAIVTGANSFIGMKITRALLSRNVEVYGIVRNQDSLRDLMDNPKLHVVEADFVSYDRLPELIQNDIDVFYHIAWNGTNGSVLGDYTAQIKNLQTTCDTLMVAHKLGSKKFIIAGTINELELLQFFHAEQSQPRLSCIYGISKLSCDLMCKTLANNLGMEYNTGIIGSCFGPGDKSRRIHNVFIANMLKDTRPKLVEGKVLTDWIYVDDVADMFCAIGEKSVNMKNYYLGHNQLKALRDVLYDVRDILNPKMDLVFGEYKDAAIVDYSLVDMNAVYEDTGYVCKSDFKECILKTAEWVRQELM